MKYFKPELLARCRSLEDEVADVAAAEWEKALVEYRARLRSIRLRLPRGARRLLSHFSLHDAKILTIAFGKKQPALKLLIQLEGTPAQRGELLELNYLLVAGPHGGVAIRKHSQFKDDASGQAWILYDEFDLDEQRAFFTHSLLLSGGFEVKIRFHGLHLRRLGEVLTTSRQLTEAERTWPLVEV
jgi:hypothetical protein